VIWSRAKTRLSSVGECRPRYITHIVRGGGKVSSDPLVNKSTKSMIVFTLLCCGVVGPGTGPGPVANPALILSL
jgi:hypothetical protein